MKITTLTSEGIIDIIVKEDKVKKLITLPKGATIIGIDPIENGFSFDIDYSDVENDNNTQTSD